MKWLIRIGLTLVICVVAILSVAFMTSTKDRGPGPDPSGFQSHSVNVPHRGVPLDVFVWYPTEDQSETQLIGQNALFYGEHVRKDAMPLKGEYPVIVYSHGSGGNGLQADWFANALVKLGYVVIAPNHAGTTSRDSLPHRTIMIWERPKDLSALLDWAETDPVPNLVMNTQKSGVIGFSLGGHSVLAVSGITVSKAKYIEYCKRNMHLGDCKWLSAGGVDFNNIDKDMYEASYADDRIDFTISVDPALPQAVVMESAENIDHPVLLVNFEPPIGTPEGIKADNLATAIPDSLYQVIPKSWHFSFLPECSLMGKFIIGLSSDENICSDSGFRDRAIVHKEFIEAMTLFLGGVGAGHS